MPPNGPPASNHEKGLGFPFSVFFPVCDREGKATTLLSSLPAAFPYPISLLRTNCSDRLLTSDEKDIFLLFCSFGLDTLHFMFGYHTCLASQRNRVLNASHRLCWWVNRFILKMIQCIFFFFVKQRDVKIKIREREKILIK